MDHVTFSDIVERHGISRAMTLLRTIEKLAQIKSEIISMDCDTRFAKAFNAMCEAKHSETPRGANFIDLDPPVTMESAVVVEPEDKQGA
jgi:hypothetical protein